MRDPTGPPRWERVESWKIAKWTYNFIKYHIAKHMCTKYQSCASVAYAIDQMGGAIMEAAQKAKEKLWTKHAAIHKPNAKVQSRIDYHFNNRIPGTWV